MYALSPRSGIQVSSVYPTYTHIKGQSPMCVCVCVCLCVCMCVCVCMHVCVCSQASRSLATLTLGFFLLFSSPEPLGSQGELIGYPSSRRPSVVVNNFKHLLLRNRWADQSQILCGASLGRGNYILFAASGSHDQDGRHAHIW